MQKREYETSQSAVIALTAKNELALRGATEAKEQEIYRLTFESAYDEIRAQTTQYELDQG